MRHGKKFNHLGRKSAHRKAMLSNMASSLIEHKAIRTTLPKARELRKYVEPLITKSKNDTMHSRRTVFSYLQNKFAVKELFGAIAPKVMDRPGGYTRILKLGPRQGDNAEMAYIELVDFNEFYTKGSASSKRRRSKKKGAKDEVKIAAEKPATPEDEPVEVAEASDAAAAEEAKNE
ncbi:MAG: 50S ribosomal protein L17 [Sphingobacteriia bacterium]|jgi:large subunit ribosomal protein L17